MTEEFYAIFDWGEEMMHGLFKDKKGHLYHRVRKKNWLGLYTFQWVVVQYNWRDYADDYTLKYTFSAIDGRRDVKHRYYRYNPFSGVKALIDSPHMLQQRLAWALNELEGYKNEVMSLKQELSFTATPDSIHKRLAKNKALIDKLTPNVFYNQGGKKK